MIANVLRLTQVVACALLGISVAQAGISHDPALTWKTLQSEHFLAHYHDGEEPIARKALAVAEQAHQKLSPVFKWTPKGRTDIIITDRFDGPNGYATPYPTNRMGIYVNAPDELDSLEDHGGWLETVITHEYAHILHLDKASGAPLVFRSIFGRFPLFIINTFPNAYQPTWMIEGLATYMETDAARGIGRGQSASFNMLMRMEVASGVKPIRQVNQPIASWPAGAVPYLYGVEYFNFIAARKGEDKIFRLVDNFSNDFLPFAINSNSKGVFKKNMDRMWDEFEIYLQEKHRPVLAQVEKQGERVGDQLTHDGYLGGPARALDDGTVIYLRNDGRSEPRLMTLRTDAKPKRLTYVHYGARFDVHPQGGVLVAQPERYRNANVYYDLYRVKLKGGATKRLTRAGRYRFATWSPDASRIAAAHSVLGNNALHLLDARGKQIEVLAQMGEDEVLSDLDWSPDGNSLVVSVWRPSGGWNLELFDLQTRSWRKLTFDGALASQPQFTRDGSGVLFTSDHGGIYNLRHLALDQGRNFTTLSNVKGGAFYPTETADAYYYTGYTAQGFDIFRLPKSDAGTLQTLATRAGVSAKVAPTPPEPSGLQHADYSPWASLAPRWWFPHLVVDVDRSEVGVTTAGVDTLQRHYYGIDTAYDFSQKNFIGSVDYIYDRWYPIFKLHADRESEFRRNDKGDVLRVRREDMYQVETVLPFLFHRREYSFHVTALQERETDDSVVAGVARQPDTVDYIVGSAFAYDSTRRYPLSISLSHGRQLSLVGEDSDAIRKSDFTGEVYTLDWREFVPLFNENVLALRFVEGWGTQNPRPFELGGTDTANTNAVFAAVASTTTGSDMLFNQREYGLRGYPRGLPQLRDRRMMLGSAEWRFPIRRIERGFMVPFPGAIDQVHAGVFVDSGAVWRDGSSPDNFYTGAGLEASADLVLFYGAPLQLRVGYAHGFDDGGKDQVYLRAGASF